MSRVRRRDTGPEVALRRALWERGLRGYRVDDPRFPGRPDVAWTTRRVAVFVDGKFWHGHPSAYKRGRHGEYWDAKIERNIRRDREVDAQLAALGWSVLRFWDFEVKRTLPNCVETIERAWAAGPTPLPEAPAQ